MFVKCARCGYLTPDGSAHCKQCGGDPAGAPTPLVAPPVAPPPVAPAPTPGGIGPGSNAAAPPPPPPPVLPAWVTDAAGPAPVPSMFPEPGARPARRSVPAWPIVTGAVVIVIALLLVVVLGGGDDSGTRNLQAAQQQLRHTDTDIANLDATLLTRADLGSTWSQLDHSGFRPDELGWNETCWDAPGLDSVATLGRTTTFAANQTPDGRNSGQADAWVKQYRTADEAEAQFEARRDPHFASCVAAFDAADAECTCGRTPSGTDVTTVPEPPDIRSIVYLDTVTYQDESGPQTFYELRGYFVHGRTLGGLSLYVFGSPPPSQALYDELLKSFSQRVALHAPTADGA